LRNVGVALGHTLIAWRALGRGLEKVAPDPARIAADIEAAWEVLGEAVQTVLRAAGAPGGYELLKDFTRGRAIDAQSLAHFIDTLPLPDNVKTQLKGLRPEGYIGLAARLARGI
jgi:adenylosuccinate lyase